MAEPLSICIEDPSGDGASGRFVQCVAVDLGTPGLSLGPDGTPAWQAEHPGLRLAVGGDGRLVMKPGEDAPAVRIHRAGRVLEPDEEDPTVLLDQDELEVGNRKLRIHLHGVACSVVPPRPFTGDGEDARGAGEATPVIQAPGGIIELPRLPTPPSPPPAPLPGPQDGNGSGEDGSSGLPGRGGPIELRVRPEPPAPLPGPPFVQNTGPWGWMALVVVLGAAAFALYWFVLRAGR